MGRFIYLDNAATTKIKPEVFAAMQPYLTERYGNPSSAYAFSGEDAKEIDAVRHHIAAFLGAKAEEIYFTSGGSESDNWALKGVVAANRNKGKHVIVSKIEHHAILHTCEFLEKMGCEVSYIDVDEDGVINVAQLEEQIRPDTILISVMLANNEIGTIEPIEEIGRIAKAHGVLLHTDAVQAYGHIPIDVNALQVDLLSASSHKINGPKGVGLLYIRKGTKIENLVHGGSQERGRRAGTTNTAGIIGFAAATVLAEKTMSERSAYETELRDHLIQRVLSEIPYTRLNGHTKNRLPNNTNFCFRFIEGESLLLLLDRSGIYASSGSACTSGALDPSHVLLSIGLPHEIAHGSLRMTISDETTQAEIDETVDKLKQIVERLRSMSPLYEDFVKKERVAL